MTTGLHLRLPATSANLGPGFDAVGLALSLYLTIEARVATVDGIAATGRDAELCGALEKNLILGTYREVCARHGVAAPPLQLILHNEIPLGMGCGSSAAAILAGVALANHFGGLRWEDAAVVAEATRIEGHPDNVAACWYGGFTVSAQVGDRVQVATFAGDATWPLLLAMQPSSLATSKARALLPEGYSRQDAIFNIQRTALLVAAFAGGHPELLRDAMQDRVHQPYRAQACPLLSRLEPLLEDDRVAGLALSGAGPSVLMILRAGTDVAAATQEFAARVGDGMEWSALRIAGGAVGRTFAL